MTIYGERLNIQISIEPIIDRTRSDLYLCLAVFDPRRL